MQLHWGSYPFKTNGVKVRSFQRLRKSEANIPLSVFARIQAEGWLEGVGESGVTQEMSRMKTAMNMPFQNLVFKQTNGQDSADFLYNNASLTGVTITEGPNFPEVDGPEYVNQRKFEFTAEAEYAFNGTENLLVSWQENITYEGGGPMYIMKRAVTGKPQRQLVYEQIEFRVVQRGEAVGFRGYPTPPDPIFGRAQMAIPAKIERADPKRVGPDNYTDYKISWEYVFESENELIGLPNLWPKGS